jgi:predicted dehydrogenase
VGQPLNVGVVGLGVISRQYFDTLNDVEGVRIVAAADIAPGRAQEVAQAHPGVEALAVDELVASAGVDVVLNLTIPVAHADVALRAIAAGRGVYGEKPLTATFDEARRVMAAAEAAGTAVWCAPDTVLGTGIQTARRAVERGDIGAPVGASATWASPGHEAWHPAPDFYYQPGGGPMMDMGPYYVTALCHLLGPIASVTSSASRRRAERRIATGPRAGETVPVEVDTHVVAILEHVGGALSTVTVSFDSAPSHAPNIEVFGEAGSMTVPDPNMFSGDVTLTDAVTRETRLLVPDAGYAEAGRGIGLVDAASGGGRASGELALHVLEVMTGVLTSATERRRVDIVSAPAIPAAVPFTPAEHWRRAR